MEYVPSSYDNRNVIPYYNGNIWCTSAYVPACPLYVFNTPMQAPQIGLMSPSPSPQFDLMSISSSPPPKSPRLLEDASPSVKHLTAGEDPPKYQSEKDKNWSSHCRYLPSEIGKLTLQYSLVFMHKVNYPLFTARIAEPNPILRPKSHRSSVAPVQWNLLLPFEYIVTSLSHQSIELFEDIPATQPSVSHLSLIFPDPHNGPWSVLVENDDGISCRDIFEKIQESLLLPVYIHEPQWMSLSKSARKTIQESYHKNRTIAGSHLPAGLRRLDFLGADIFFGGLTPWSSAKKWSFLRRKRFSQDNLLPCFMVELLSLDDIHHL